MAMFPHAKIMPEHDQWLNQVKAHGSVNAYYKRVWPNLTGDLRLHVLEQQLRPDMPVTLLSYTHEQRQRLRDADLLADMEPGTTCVNALLKQLDRVVDSRLQAHALGGCAELHSLQDMWIVAQNRLKHSLLLKPNLTAALKRRLKQLFGQPIKILDQAKHVQPWVWDAHCGMFQEKLHQLINEALTRRLEEQRAPSRRTKEARVTPVQALHAWATSSALGSSHPAQRRAWLHEVLSWLAETRLHRAFERCNLAMRLLLNHVMPDDAEQYMERVRRQSASQMAELLRVCKDAAAQVGQDDAESTMIGASGASLGSADANMHMSGHGMAQRDVQAGIMRQVLLAIYQQMRHDVETWIQQACPSNMM